MAFYPKAPVSVSIVKLDKATVAAAMITRMEAGDTKAQALGPVLAGSDDVATFNEVWAELLAEKIALRAVDATLSSDETAYKVELTKVKTYADVTLFYDGYLAEQEVADFAALKTKLEA